jgi:glutamyl-tRNA reductase
MITHKIKESVEQIRQSELNRHRKSLKGCETLVAEEVTQRFIDKFIRVLELQLLHNDAEEHTEALALLFAVPQR